MCGMCARLCWLWCILSNISYQVQNIWITCTKCLSQYWWFLNQKISAQKMANWCPSFCSKLNFGTYMYLKSVLEHLQFLLCEFHAFAIITLKFIDASLWCNLPTFCHFHSNCISAIDKSWNSTSTALHFKSHFKVHHQVIDTPYTTQLHVLRLKMPNTNSSRQSWYLD